MRGARWLGLLILLIFSLSSSGQAHYIKKYKKLSDSLSKIYKIPSAVILGVAIVESSSGKGKNCKMLNNHFGIVGKNNLRKTKKIKTRYKQYPSAKTSYVDFCKVISKRKFYTQLKGNNDAALWIDHISKTGYSEQPQIWKKRILAIIEKYKL